MALTRKMLKEMGINEDSAEKIILAHSETVDALKQFRKDSERLEAAEEELMRTKHELDNSRAMLEENGKQAADYRCQLEAIQKEYDDYRSGAESRILTDKKENALKRLLYGCGVFENAIEPIISVTKLDSLELDDSGCIIGSDQLSKELERKWSAFIPSVTTVGAVTASPPANNGEKVYTREDLRKMSLNEINRNYQQIRKSLSGADIV